MANSAKRKGDRAELEVQAWLIENLGVPARRKLGAGRQDDMGDIDGVPLTVIQVVNKPSDTLRAIREKPIQAEQQRRRAGEPFAATFVRLKGGEYRVVMTPEQWATMWREAAA